SASGVLGTAGQSTYAAANTALDTLAALRRSEGLAATSLSWGLWQQAGIGLTAALGQADVARMRRQGFGALSQQQALAALDAALLQPYAHLVPVKLETARVEDPPALLRALVRRRRRPAAGTTTSGGRGTVLRDRLAGLPEGERLPYLVQLVRSEAAVVLGASSADGVGDHQAFKELGLDSLMAVELRRRLSAATEVALPATLAFDHPTPAAVAGLLLDRYTSEATAQAGVVPTAVSRAGAHVTKTQIDSLVDLLRAATPQQLEEQGLVSRLLELKDGLARTVVPDAPEIEIEAGSTEDLLQFLDRKLGV
ncbi:phosphopantetheine-binding protein, partial [Streptomyces sp. OZ13]|uniref:acyl carrier protein n=1 Tax=Streptomyces sp. OZ13 TaxID=3452210 RepID=UPI003F88CEC1